jgi:hypothetical protein
MIDTYTFMQMDNAYVKLDFNNDDGWAPRKPIHRTNDRPRLIEIQHGVNRSDQPENIE